MTLCYMNENYVGDEINYLFRVAINYLRCYALRWQQPIIFEHFVIDTIRGLEPSIYHFRIPSNKAVDIDRNVADLTP